MTGCHKFVSRGKQNHVLTWIRTTLCHLAWCENHLLLMKIVSFCYKLISTFHLKQGEVYNTTEHHGTKILLLWKIMVRNDEFFEKTNHNHVPRNKKVKIYIEWKYRKFSNRVYLCRNLVQITRVPNWITKKKTCPRFWGMLNGEAVTPLQHCKLFPSPHNSEECPQLPE